MSLLRDLVVIATGVGGLIWAIYKSWKTWETSAIPEIALDLTSLPIDLRRLVSIIITIKNVGKAGAYFKAEALGKAFVSVRKIQSANTNVPLSWRQLEKESLIDHVNYFGDWMQYYPEEPMIFEPGTTLHFNVQFATDYLGPVWVRAELTDDDDYKWAADGIFTIANQTVQG